MQGFQIHESINELLQQRKPEQANCKFLCFFEPKRLERRSGREFEGDGEGGQGRSRYDLLPRWKERKKEELTYDYAECPVFVEEKTCRLPETAYRCLLTNAPVGL